MRLRLLLLSVPAAALAAADLVHKAVAETPPEAYHPRSAAWAALSTALVAGTCVLLLVPSRAVALAGGVTTGGVLGNLFSAGANDGAVPNPIVVSDDAKMVAFNLADVFVLAGILLLVGTLIRASIRHRDRLLPPREWERRLRDRIGL